MRRTSTEACHLAWDSVRLANLVSPVVSSFRDDGELGQEVGPLDGRGYLLGTLNTQPDMTIVVPNGYRCLEPGALASPSLLLHRHDLQDLILEGAPRKKSIISDSLMGREKR
jgi:hypothetical protein